MTTVPNSAAVPAAGLGAGFARRATAAALAAAATLRRWRRRQRDLRHVLQLDDHLLRDVGLTRDQLAHGVFTREARQWRG
jgi:uncharacterized protein YjiS (DUF1127 family)